MASDQLPIPPSSDNIPALHASASEGSALAVRGSNLMRVESGGNHDEDTIDLLAYWHIILKHRWLVLGVLLSIVAITLVWTLLTPSVYRASATLQIEPYGMQVVQVQGISPVQGRWDPNFSQTQYELLKSRSLAERVAEDLHLADSDIFDRMKPPGWLDRVRELLAPKDEQAPPREAGTTQEALSEAQAEDLGEDRPLTAEEKLAKVTGLIQGGLSIDPVRNSYLVNVQYDSALPEFAARVANAAADGFVALSLDQQYGASSYAKQYLEDQLALHKSRLEQSERALVEYAKTQDIVPGADGRSLVEQNLSDLNRSLANAQDQRIRAQARWEQVKATTDGALPADMLKDTVIPMLEQKRAQMEGEYQQKLQTFKPDYPPMLALQAQIDDVKRQVDQELARIRSSVNVEYNATVAQEDLLKSQLEVLREESLNVDSRSIEYNILKREVDSNREIYNGLLQRYKQVGLASDAKTSNITIVDRAIVPNSRYSPSLRRNLALGMLLGLMLGVGLALLLEYLDNTFKSPQDIEQKLHLGVLGIIPKLSSKQTPQQALADPRSAFAESYRSVRTALQFSTARGVPKVLLITSSVASEGKSTSAHTLAQQFTQLGKRVLLIDADLRNPGLGRLMGLKAPNGLSSLLSGSEVLSKVLVHTDNPNLDVLLSGPLPPSPTELLAGMKFVSLMTVAANKYDQIIIDGPPVLGIADALILANVAVGTLLVVQSGSTRIQSVQASLHRLQMTRARVIGCLLTQYDANQSGYGYRYEGYYGYSYGAETAPRLGRG